MREKTVTELNRRSLLTGTAAVTAAAPSLLVHAAAPPVGKQAPGYYRYRVGDIEVTAVTDGATRFRFPDGFVANKSRDEVNAAWAAMFQEKDQMLITYTPLAVNTGSKLVVVDTGTSEANFERSKGAAGQFHSNLVASGINPDQVDTVIISHFHGDHINGLLGKDDKPKFTKAEILVPAAEWKYFMDDGEMGKQTTDRMKGGSLARGKCLTHSAARSRPMRRTRNWRPASPQLRLLAIRPATCHSSSPLATTRCSCSRMSPTIRCLSAIRTSI
jgi:hypothetical protein